MESAPPLVLVSNRGPVESTASDVKRGSGGLVTALTGLASHRDAIWVASAMSEQDVEKSEEHGGRPFVVQAPGGGEYRVRFVASDAEAYDRFYNVFANPILWFIQHYLWDLSNAPDIRRHEVEAFEFGYNVVNEDLARAGIEEIQGLEGPVGMVHDHHLYTLPALGAPPPRPPDPAGGPRRPVQERAARVYSVRHLPRPAPRVRGAGHVRGSTHAVADRRARVRGIPRADRGARGRGQPSPRNAGLDADPAQAARRPRGGRGGIQALRRAARQRDVRRAESRRQGGSVGQPARRRIDPVGEHRRPRGARRVCPLGEPVRHPGAGRLHPRRADDERGRARAAGKRAQGDRHTARPGGLDRRAAGGHPREGERRSARRRRRYVAPGGVIRAGTP